jgi:hypothetical protein
MTLAADMITDLDVFLNSDEFAVSATYGATTTKVLLTKEDGNALGMDGTIIVIEGKTSVFSAAKPGDAITVSGTAHKIKTPPFHDGTGMTRMELSID